MSLINYNEITVHKYIEYEGEPWEVLDSRVFRMQQRKPVNQTKLKSLMTGRVSEITFHQSDKVPEAEIEEREIKYLYSNKGEFWFCEINNPSKRFKMTEAEVGQGGKFLKGNTLVGLQSWKEKQVGLRLPIKVELKVVEAPPAVKGDTAKGGSKQIKLETGATINAPLFINEGEMIRVNTATGEYVERVN
ncbi:MAG: elongation factor P [Candidatus Taylorbacteria bacterium]|nr:elongation factor P [Candidatus Taylorbacteria bacterium]